MTEKKRKKRSRPSSRDTGENRTAEAVTVAWMLTTLATLVAEVLAAIGWGVALALAKEDNLSRAFALVPLMLTFVATVTGILCLLLIPVAHRMRRVPPPRSVTVFSAIVGVLPAAVLLGTLLARR